MNSVASDPVLIGLDWGTSSLRAALIGAQGEVLDKIATSDGILHVDGADFESTLTRLLAPWDRHGGLAMVASGMITSRNGWVETPYAALPARSDALAHALVRHRLRDGRCLHFITGLACDTAGAPDVMRGEETQIIGAVAAGIGEGLFVMPGTHSKWVTVRDGAITGFATYMTGDVFAALKNHTILTAFMRDAPFHEPGFRLGVVSGLEAEATLLHRLFHVRSLPLFERIPPEASADYLSGLLIGTEIAGAAARHDGPVTIVGRSDLAARYEIALAIAQHDSRRADEDIAARGQFTIAKAAGVIP